MHLSYRSNVICSNDRRKKAAGSGTRVLKSIASLSQRKRENTSKFDYLEARQTRSSCARLTVTELFSLISG